MKTVDTDTRCAIEALVAEHAYRVDHNLSDRVYELYTEDGSLTGLATMNLPDLDAIRAWGAERVHDTDTVVRHIQSNLRLRWEDGVLRGQLYYQMLRGNAQDTSNAAPISMGEFDDEYAQVDGEWRIRTRMISRFFFTPPRESESA
ncbi:nuclear transport factor 2 family protein [Rhodococcus hoagii]|nr:nuclear transport factor 2 family protein [Prescottella equi]